MNIFRPTHGCRQQPPTTPRWNTHPLLARCLAVSSIIFCAFVHAQDDEAALTATLSVPQSSFANGAVVEIEYTLHNPFDHALHVLHWRTPLLSSTENAFAVTRDGQPVRFIQAHFKRGDPAPDAYVEIGPGESRSAVLDLSTNYDLSSPGVYVVRSVGWVFDAISDRSDVPRTRDEFERMAVSSNELRLEIVGQPLDPNQNIDRHTQLDDNDGSVNYHECSSDEKSQIKSALQLIEDDFGTVMSAAADGAESDTKWEACENCEVMFGKWDESRAALVEDTYEKIAEFLTGTINFYCDGEIPGRKTDCEYGTFAFTNKPDIALCKNFWRAPKKWRKDSQAGTILHELSHWADTDDNAYGCSSCKKLAKKHASQAVENADSYEYFAEFTVAEKKACGVGAASLASFGFLMFYWVVARRKERGNA